MKTLTIAEAEQMGFQTIRGGAWGRFLPVVLPREMATHKGFYENIIEQFEGVTEPSENDKREDKEGRFLQVFQWTHGDGNVYIVKGFYSPENGIEEWTVFGAVKVS